MAFAFCHGEGGERKVVVEEEGPHPLLGLKKKTLGGVYELLLEVRPRRYVEQKYFELIVLDEHDHRSSPPVFQGVYSDGRKVEGIKGWVDGDYHEEVGFSCGKTLNLLEEGLDVELFKLLGGLVPEGGSLMVSYELFYRESGTHRKTSRALFLGAPPLVTPIGYLLSQAGCGTGFKDWYIAEGGNEGPKKLQGFKALNENHARVKAGEAVKELEEFLDRDFSEQPILEELKGLAAKILEKLRGGRGDIKPYIPE